MTEELCTSFDVIARRAMTTPKDTAELKEIAEEMKEIRGPGGKMATVDKDVRATKDRLLFLCGETQMTPRDIRINTDVFVWPQRMEGIFQEGIRSYDSLPHFF